MLLGDVGVDVGFGNRAWENALAAARN
jgi:hypothetical protein